MNRIAPPPPPPPDDEWMGRPEEPPDFDAPACPFCGGSHWGACWEEEAAEHDRLWAEVEHNAGCAPGLAWLLLHARPSLN
jgi:hypothetical protein